MRDFARGGSDYYRAPVAVGQQKRQIDKDTEMQFDQPRTLMDIQCSKHHQGERDDTARQQCAQYAEHDLVGLLGDGWQRVITLLHGILPIENLEDYGNKLGCLRDDMPESSERKVFIVPLHFHATGGATMALRRRLASWPAARWPASYPV